MSSKVSGSRVHISGLQPYATEEQLGGRFGRFAQRGPAAVEISRDFKGDCDGSATIIFQTAQEAISAIQALKDVEFDGARLTMCRLDAQGGLASLSVLLSTLCRYLHRQHPLMAVPHLLRDLRRHRAQNCRTWRGRQAATVAAHQAAQLVQAQVSAIAAAEYRAEQDRACVHQADQAFQQSSDAATQAQYTLFSGLMDYCSDAFILARAAQQEAHNPTGASRPIVPTTNERALRTMEDRLNSMLAASHCCLERAQQQLQCVDGSSATSRGHDAVPGHCGHSGLGCDRPAAGSERRSRRW
ncbi:hypothetical protein JKP88DRAFT_244365 [Tribonema minus]|uniref:RRM domain-containing protein n=1 Tax=Tribonema minus TaxID=303371 RepID=A0A835ZB87_9STRA|nr:hypothetical protein JKP88DRAFT_244365 [Tribonema minus]